MPGEIKIIRLITKETIIGEIVDADKKTAHVRFPMAIEEMPQFEENLKFKMSLFFLPYQISYMDSYVITIKKEHIMHMDFAKDKIRDFYFEFVEKFIARDDNLDSDRILN